MLKILFWSIGVWLCVNSVSAQWQRVPSPSDRVFSFAANDGLILAGSENTGLWRSTDDGASFAMYPTGLYEMSFDIRGFEMSGETIWTAVNGGGVCRSDDGGTTWRSFNEGFETQSFAVGVILLGDTLYAAVDYWMGLQPSGVYKTPAGQANWRRTGSGFPETLSGVTSFASTESGVMLVGAILAGPHGNVQVSRDRGQTWVNRGIRDIQGVMTLESDGDRVYAGTTSGMYVTDDFGETWEKLASPFHQQPIDDILIHDRTLFAAADNMGVLVSGDNGTSWTNITGLLPVEEDFVSALFVYGGHLFAALSASNGVWRIPLSSTAVEEDTALPEAVTLWQNYPNPFNPSTTIRFRLPRRTHVTLAVFDVTGRTVASLVDGVLDPGVHSVVFNASGLASGLYLCRLRAGASSHTGKLLLLR